jgi:glycosyltransferase involved in cell wall biosynthesis
VRADWLAHAGTALARERVCWIFFGGGSDTPPDGFPSGVGARSLGWLEQEQASRVFRALDAAAAPFADGLTLRRTSAMAALAHGVPLVSSRGPLFDPSLEAAAICAESPADFTAALRRLAADPAAREAQGRRGRDFYTTAGSVEVLARLLLAELGTP